MYWICDICSIYHLCVSLVEPDGTGGLDLRDIYLVSDERSDIVDAVSAGEPFFSHKADEYFTIA